MGWDISDNRDAASQLERAQKVIEYGLALVIPVLLAMMLYSYVLFDILFTPLFILTIVLAALLMFPAYQALRLHYRCWARNTMPQRLVTGLVGTIYISAASVFGVSLLSIYKGLDPEQPLTFAVLVLFALILIGIMAYNGQFKARNERTDIKFYQKDTKVLTNEIKKACASRMEDCTVVENGRTTSIMLPNKKVAITIKRQASDHSEVLLECQDPLSNDLCSALKQTLDQEA